MTAALAALLLVPTAPPADHLAALRGRWQVVALTNDGHRVEYAGGPAFVLTVRRGRMRLAEPGGRAGWDLPYRAAGPGAVDLVFRGQAATRRLAYRVAGGRLTVAFAGAGGGNPRAGDCDDAELVMELVRVGAGGIGRAAPAPTRRVAR